MGRERARRPRENIADKLNKLDLTKMTEKKILNNKM
jgi:hypothetical protein